MQANKKEKKKIIVDGIDVGECSFVLERNGKIKCECCHATGFGVICDCEAWKNCDHKQLKQKERELVVCRQMLEANSRELDRLEKENSTHVAYAGILEDSLTKKNQEFDKLKEDYLELKEKNGSNIVKLNTANEQLEKLKKLKKYKQVLIKIKNRIEKNCKVCKKSDFYYFKLCVTCKPNEILQEIKKVLENEN